MDMDVALLVAAGLAAALALAALVAVVRQAAAMERLTARPMPMPSLLSLQKGSNSLSMSSSFRPGPLSATQMRTSLPRALSRSSVVVLEGTRIRSPKVQTVTSGSAARANRGGAQAVEFAHGQAQVQGQSGLGLEVRVGLCPWDQGGGAQGVHGDR